MSIRFFEFAAALYLKANSFLQSLKGK